MTVDTIIKLIKLEKSWTLTTQQNAFKAILIISIGKNFNPVMD